MNKKPLGNYLLVTLLFFLCINGIIGGLLLIIKPDGELLGMESGWLTNSPFSSYLIPGVLLFLFNGIFPAITLMGLLFKPKWKLCSDLNIYKNKQWPWTFSIYTGISLIVWITLQQILTRYFWIQPLMTFIGVLILVFALLPNVISYYSNDTANEN